MNAFVERADANESDDVQALRELAVEISVDGVEPSAAVAPEGGVVR